MTGATIGTAAMKDDYMMDRALARKMGHKPAEDDPDYKWWKQGNQKAGFRHAVKNPPPRGWSVHVGKAGRVQAGEPQPDAVPGNYTWRRGRATTLGGSRTNRSSQIRGLKGQPR